MGRDGESQENANRVATSVLGTSVLPRAAAAGFSREATAALRRGRQPMDSEFKNGENREAATAGVDRSVRCRRFSARTRLRPEPWADAHGDALSPLRGCGERPQPTGSESRHTVGVLAILLFTLLFTGCSRRQYRLDADCDASQLISERVRPAYFLPDRAVEAASFSRMADLTDPDCGPLPPDDPAARRYMDSPYKSSGSTVWKKRGELPVVEFEHWQNLLPIDEAGAVRLDRTTSMELALLHSREYQTAVEGVYLTALPVALQRFQFDTQWNGGVGAEFFNRGINSTGATDTLTFTDSLGFSKRFATGGQLLADFSNAMVWEFNSGGMSTNSLLSFQLLQPLMRRAFRSVQLEPLTQAERNLLYSIRNFSQFRRAFYVDTTGTSGYLGLLAVAQAARNEESNLESLRLNLEEHDALFFAGSVSQFQVDQVFQQYEQSRLSLLRARQDLDVALDQFKLQLGLPPTLKVTLGSDELKLFELTDPRLEALTERNDEIRIQLLQFSELRLPADEDVELLSDRDRQALNLRLSEIGLPAVEQIRDLTPQERSQAEALYAASNLPTIEELQQIHAAARKVADQVPVFADEIREELQRWKSSLEEEDASADSDETAIENSEFERERDLCRDLEEFLNEITDEFSHDADQADAAAAAIERSDRLLAWQVLNVLVGENLRERLADLFVVQTQVRVYLIEIQPVEITESAALFLANENRLDLKNVQGQVVDAYRGKEVAADLLEADLDLILGADIGTDPSRTNPARFDASASTLRAGLQFDGPLNRMAERNVYRASQIEYQRARRDFMEAKDGISFEVRNNLRNLELNRFQFEITRQQLITAARQVEQAQLNLRISTEADSNLTRDLLQALQTLLGARNSLISSWVRYETSRMELYRTLELLQIDDNGNWVNDGQLSDDFLAEIFLDDGTADGFPVDGRANETEDSSAPGAADDASTDEGTADVPVIPVIELERVE